MKPHTKTIYPNWQSRLLIKSKADIPNVEGFEFIGVQNDGSCVDCVVKKDGKGLHYIDNFENIIGWVS